ncbi:methyltransferase family protein [Dyadobacter pollutisoli]|uniref:Isoprenylcysteine carboxylmethyltransferase family protein n=1 Tax=Dyadobacter pollutisoli TaxID=2910158 RepID=A0A9E8NAF1_9BACT|nr:isoprenylcysteine carboxylmethyltransferase family protein [Dyadobacter pollutisoli]WAC12323.1 isoprenylcysteine carboxylmethyltransferase family protein [Dyadobacter pollutisoli]
MELNKEFDRQGNFLFRHRSILPLLIILPGLCVFIFVNLEKAGSHVNDFPEQGYQYFCLGITLLGLLIRALTVGYAQKNTSGRNTQNQVADHLNTSGMYSIVRHPLYLGNFFMWLGVAMLTQHTWFIVAFTLVYWFYYERIMFAEEQYIKTKFGEVFSDWAAKTPAIVPNIFQWHNPDLDFSFRKVLRQEKNGLAAIFILFFLFDTIAEYIAFRDVQFRHGEWIILFTAGCVLYIILKFLKNNTQVLNAEGGR